MLTIANEYSRCLKVGSEQLRRTWWIMKDETPDLRFSWAPTFVYACFQPHTLHITFKMNATATASRLQWFSARLAYCKVWRRNKVGLEINEKSWTARWRKHAHVPLWRFPEWLLHNCLCAGDLLTSKNQLPVFSFFHFFLSSLLAAIFRNMCCLQSEFFGTVNLKTDLNFKQQLPGWWTCRRKAGVLLVADETDSVCRLLTLLHACLLPTEFVLFYRSSLAEPVFGNHLTAVSSFLSTFHQISTHEMWLFCRLAALNLCCQ